MQLQESRPTPAVEEKPPVEPYELNFDYNADSGFHEAYIAVNAISDLTVRQFEPSTIRTFAETWDERLKIATELVLENGGTSILFKIQRELKDKTKDGKLETSITVGVDEQQIGHLGHGLRLYAKDTEVRVPFLAATGFLSQAHTRAVEGRYALDMFSVIEQIFVVPEIEDPRRPVGYGAKI